MGFQIGHGVVYPAFGVGRLAGLVAKALYRAESRVNYQVSGHSGTVSCCMAGRRTKAKAPAT